MDIRRETTLIIKKDKKYLVGRDPWGTLMWNTSPWAAWRTRIRANAKSIQQKVGGEIMLFNPINGQIRKAEI